MGVMNVDNDEVSLQLNSHDDVLTVPSTRQGPSRTQGGVGYSCEDHRMSSSGSWRRCAPIKMSPSVRVALASSMAAVGGVMFGYDTGVISGALLQLRTDFDLGCHESEIMVSSLLAGALIASFCGGFLVDYCGRKETIIINDVLFLVGTILLTTASTFAMLVAGRVIVGFAVCLSATAECVYISEISPPKKRGFLVSLNELGITIGFLLAYIVGYLFISVDNGWRYMFSFGVVLAILQAVGMAFLPPSPRFFVLRGKDEQARVVLFSLLEPAEAEEEFCRIRHSVEEERKRHWKDAFRGADGICRRFLIVMPLMLLQQLTGQTTVLFYAPIVFQEVGFRSNTSAILASVGLGTVKMVVTLIYLALTNRAGRRTFLLIGSGLMFISTVAFGACAAAFFIEQPIADSCRKVLPPSAFNDSLFTNITKEANLDATTTSQSIADIINPAGSWLSLICILVYVTGYSIGFGPGTWLVLSEIFPTYIKGRAIAVATSFNWSANFIVSITFLSVITTIGTAATFWMYSGVCLLSIVYIAMFLPETKDRSLEDVTATLLGQQRHQCHWSIGSLMRNSYYWAIWVQGCYIRGFLGLRTLKFSLAVLMVAAVFCGTLML